MRVKPQYPRFRIEVTARQVDAGWWNADVRIRLLASETEAYAEEVQCRATKATAAVHLGLQRAEHWIHEHGDPSISVAVPTGRLPRSETASG